MSTDCKGYNKFCFRLEILFLPMCVCGGGVHVGGGTHGGQKGALDPMELQLYMVVKPSGMGAGNSLNL